MNLSWIIEDELMVSSLPDSYRMLTFIREAGIRAIVSTVPLITCESDLASIGIEHLYLPINISEKPTLKQLRLFISWSRFMQKARQPIMVHSEFGLERSPTLCACYLVVEKGMTAEHAISEIRYIRGDDCIHNDNLMEFVYECEHVKPLLIDLYDQAFFDSLMLIDILRKRCPWDKEQNPLKIMPNLLEETYETWEAIAQDNIKEIASELGDVLMQVIMISKMLSETRNFSILNVTNSMIEKLIFRHPHIFANSKTNTTDKVVDQWDKLKDENLFSIVDIPTVLPPLIRAERVMSFAKKLGFDWSNVEGVVEKLDEEVAELKEAIELNENIKINSEFGDVFFVLLNLARFLKINPELALTGTLNTFIKRFRQIEVSAKSINKNIEEMSPDEMDVIWNQAKKTNSN